MSFGPSDPVDHVEQLETNAPASLDWRAFALGLSEALRPLNDPIAIQRAACRVLGECLDADAVQYAEILDGGAAVATQEHVRWGASPGRQYVARAFGEQAVAAFKAGVSLVVHDVSREPQLSASARVAFDALGVAASIGTGLVKDGRWVATLTATCTLPKAWTSMHVAMLEETIERTWTAAEHARIEAALRENEERQAFLLALGDTIRRLGHPTAILAETCRLLGLHLRVNRVAYGEFDGNDCTITSDFVDGVASMAGRFRWTPFAGDFDHELKTRQVLVVRDTATDPRTANSREALKAADIGAFITPLLVKDGRYVGAFGIHSRTPRVWTQSEITLVREVAERIWAALEQCRAEEALRDSEARLDFLLKLNDALQPLSDPAARQEAAARLLCEHLGVSRVCYADIGDEFVVRHSYTSGKAPSVGRGRLSRVGAVLMSSYERADVVAVHDVRVDGRFTQDERATLLEGDIAAFAGMLIWKDGRRHGAFGVHSATPRVWTPAEVDLIRDVGERTWEAMERAGAEAELREREWRLRLALNASGGGSWTWDASTNHVDWDEGFRSRYGFSLEESPSHDAWLSRVHDDDRQQVVELLDEMLQTTKDSWDNTFRIVLPSGDVRWIQSLGRADRTADGQPIRLTGLDLDITERRRAEEALQARYDEERDRELQMLLETAAQGIASVDARGLIVTANRAMEQMFGWEKGELIGRSIERLVPWPPREVNLRPGHDHSASYPRLIGRDLDMVGRRKDGSTFPIEITSNHVATHDGGRAIAFVTDISARKRAENALQERTLELQHRTTQLSQMASDLTLAEQHAREQLAKTLHDGLQQLLVGASMHLELHARRDAQQGAPPAELLVEAKHHIDEAVAAARSLSFELFPPVLHHSGLPAALKWLADWTRQKYGLDVRVSAESRANSDRKDVRTLLFESVRELLFNAVKHAQADWATVDLRVGDDDELCITVADEGIGFDPAALADQAKSSQVGWGLFSIRERLTLLGGRFEIHSAPGQGTRFRLIAPGRIAPAPIAVLDPASRVAAASPSGRTSGPATARALRILLVDDHAAMRKALRGLLQARAELHVVGEASNGVDAITQARAHRPDVILMDVSMPEMDGIEATRRIHTELPFIQILGLSMQLRTDSPHAIERAGARGFFTKGIDTQRLLDELVATQARRSQAGIGA